MKTSTKLFITSAVLWGVLYFTIEMFSKTYDSQMGGYWFLTCLLIGGLFIFLLLEAFERKYKDK